MELAVKKILRCFLVRANVRTCRKTPKCQGMHHGRLRSATYQQRRRSISLVYMWGAASTLHGRQPAALQVCFHLRAKAPGSSTTDNPEVRAQTHFTLFNLCYALIGHTAYSLLVKKHSTVTLDLPNAPDAFPVFYTSELPPFKENDNTISPIRTLNPPKPILINGEQEFFIEKIVDERTRNKQTQYNVHWQGGGPERMSIASLIFQNCLPGDCDRSRSDGE